MIGTDAGCDVRGQVFARQGGAVSVDDGTGEGVELLEHLGIAVDHTGKVHYFCQAENPGVAPERTELVTAQHGTAGLHVSRRNTRRGHHEHAQRTVLGALEHEPNSLQAEDVGDLVGVGDHGGCSHGNDGAGELCWRHKAAFDMNMRIDEPRCHE